MEFWLDGLKTGETKGIFNVFNPDIDESFKVATYKMIVDNNLKVTYEQID